MNESIKEKRKQLSLLTKDLAPLVTAGQFDSINTAIIAHYSQATNTPKTDFKTFKQWKRDGFFVRKGEKSFPIWGSPIGDNQGNSDNGKFFPLCFLFGKHQVEPIKDFKNDKVLHNAAAEA